jgi:hypothetical protein
MAEKFTFKAGTFIRRDGGSIIKKTSLALVLFLSILCNADAQDHHHDDSLVILEKRAFIVNILTSSDSSFQLEVLNNQFDSITPFFIEFSINGFLFTQDCILEQRLNNLPIEQNIEKIFGPQFVALGIGQIPPMGNYRTTLATFNKNKATPSSIQVRIFGMVKGHNVIWNGHLKN